MIADSSEPLNDLRRQFDLLGLQHKAEFLVDATFRTFAAGVEAAGAALSRELDHMFSTVEAEAEQTREAAGAPTEASEAPGTPPRRKKEASPGAAEGSSPAPEDL